MKRLLSLTTSLAAFVLSSASVPTPVLCPSGTADGVWELPFTSQGTGQLSGFLHFGSTPNVAYLFTAILTDVPTPCLSCIEGEISGALDDGIGPGPDYVVRGSYRGVFLNGTGEYRAEVLTPGGAHRVGRLRGTFSDQPGIPGPGTFAGTWRVCP